MMEMCGDNRFEIIEKAKAHLLEGTNIDTSPEEMKVLDNFLFRCWQMGWLDKYDNSKLKDIISDFKSDKDVQIATYALAYAKNLILYGVDISEKFETATEMSISLEKAYLRGRADEREKAIAAWNHRKPMERILERLEEYRDDFMDDIYEELREDTDNLRANRIIDRFDEAIEIVKEEGGLNE